MGCPSRPGILALLLCIFACTAAAADSALPVVAASDNRAPAGQLVTGVLNLHLELQQGRWYPGDDKGVYRDVYAFAEQGHAPQSSGPLIRVPEGTRINITLRNTLPVAAKLYGLHQHPGDPNSAVTLAAGETRERQFTAGEPGTYLYWATTADHSLLQRTEEETLLSGAFVVDASGTTADDHIFVITMWTKGKEEFPAINGKSWPLTERLRYKIGDTAHWRVLNASSSDHAMHLHGFFFTVEGAGDGERFERYSPDQRRFEVTEHIDAGRVFEMTWQPERAGNWLFHCHMVAHMEPLPEARTSEPPPGQPAHDHTAGMGGLVVGISILPGAATPVATAVAKTEPHKVQLIVSDNPDKIPSYKVEVNDPLLSSPPANAKKRPSLLGPPIILFRGQPAEIEVKNQSSYDTAIHWHGIELESYYDGVPGYTGSGQQISPPIPPGGSFIARMTPPRTGTFIYHSHAPDPKQLVNGLYGPLIVLDPGQKYDPDRDKTFVISLGRYSPLPTMLLINGTPQPYPANLQIATRYRFRLINITDNVSDLRVRLVANDAPLHWKLLAKDGADLPPSQCKSAVADMPITVGETYDVEYEADQAGTADLQFWLPSFPVLVTQPLTFAASQ
jgi:FtsP/CotA-like multicopper oxidase with cupredoxin domain